MTKPKTAAVGERLPYSTGTTKGGAFSTGATGCIFKAALTRPWIDATANWPRDRRC